MSAGTLTLTNNSAAVAGSGTAFTTELATGDFIVVTVGGIPYTLPVKTVNSNTSLILVSNFTGPTQSGLAWSAVPRLALNMVTAALVAQSAEALRGLNYDKQNWQQVFSGTGNITVKLPDGTSYTGPAWGGIATALVGKADITDLGSYAKKGANSDITSLSGLRTPLSIAQGGTGQSSTDQYCNANGVLYAPAGMTDWGHSGSTMFARAFTGGTNSATGNVMMGLNIPHSGSPHDYVFQIGGRGNSFYSRCKENGTWGNWVGLTVYALSDETMKNIKGDLNVEGSLDNINRMKFKIFSYLSDGPDRSYRRGVISQQIRKIDREYTKKIDGLLCLDETPMLLDGLAAIQALTRRDRINKDRIACLETEVSGLKSSVQELLSLTNNTAENNQETL